MGNIRNNIFKSFYAYRWGCSDIIDYPPVPNNDEFTAQTILNPTDVIGHIGDNVETVVVLGDDGFCRRS